MVVCDTHVLLFWASAPDRLSGLAATTIERELESGRLACADISLWEIAMLASRGRIEIPVPLADYLRDIVLAMKLEVLPITPEIAALAQDPCFRHGDPADRLIGASALQHRAALITADRQLAGVDGLRVIW